MNIVIGKIGKSCKFDPKKWDATGGSNEAPSLYITLAKHNPQNTYYLIGRNDFSRLPIDYQKEICPNNNIIDLWQFYDKTKDNFITFTHEYLIKNNIKIDCGIICAGIATTINVPNYMKKTDGTYPNILETFKNYTGPVVYYLNESKIPYFTVSVDPRYHPNKARDLFNRAKFSLSQFNDNEHFIATHIKSVEDQTLTTTLIPTKYSGVEKMVFLDKERRLMNLDKSIKMMVILNEGGNGGLLRGPLLKEYVLNNFQDISVYGQWDEKWYEDTRFKGPLKFKELENVLPDVKYTFIIPIQKGWATAKFWEMAHFGIIPFMHPYYDQQKNIDCPDFLRVKDPQDFLNKIEYLENNPEEYKKLRLQLDQMILDSYYNGEYLNNVMNEGIKELDV